ncbi:serine/threonine protein kinase [Gloeothece citriformis PCC 7424]|uniref:Serine/threonine protein kinase n=1 Tax=Gloeothece citriformis (strain PCC 7424) TaxID=65393 RepID=B7K7L7_GLOC7|nr:RDD family protein [Gloeothece citriformis]ACK69785.1 serine/threonine protein kinase [Gloeothece citriformis PCC 7424]
MSLCINPGCSKPENPDINKFCQACGSELLLIGRYRVTRLLSNKGGFGYTYEVMDKDTPKVLKVLINPHPHAVDLFKQEAEVLSKLNHPGIPKGEGYFIYFSRNSETPLHCLVMEKIEGMDLEEYQRQHEFAPIKQDLALEWLFQLVNILNEVHRRQFFHRDIKPSNIILKPDGQLTLIDFGAVRQVTRTILVGGQNTGIYTPGYAPPEQERGYAVPQSDFYALGRTFVYLLTGKEPNDSAIYDYHKNELNWHGFAPQIHEKLANFIDTLMADKVVNRPADTTIIFEQLSHLKQEILQSPTSPSPQTLTQNQTLNQPTQKIISLTPPSGTMVKYGGFWERLKAAIIDEIIVMVLAGFLGGYISYNLEKMGYLARWGIEISGIDLILLSSVLSLLGTTVIGLILIILGLDVFLFNSDFLTYFLSLIFANDIPDKIIGLFREHLLWLIPVIFGALIKWLYFVFLESLFKGTLGKRFLGLRVSNLQNQSLNLPEANKRYWGKLLSGLPLYIGFMLAGWTPKKRALHDIIAGSIVVKKNKQ